MLQGVLRPGHVQIRVTDMGSALRHYVEVLGLLRVHKGNDGRVYLKAWDEHDHHSLILREADRPGMDFLGFKVSSDAELDRLADAVRDFGLEVEELPEGDLPMTGRRAAFTCPTGHRLELYAAKARVGNGLGNVNPEVKPDDLKGMRPTRFDHACSTGTRSTGTWHCLPRCLAFTYPSGWWRATARPSWLPS